MGKDDDDEDYITNKHDPDLSENAWDDRWERSKQQKQHARNLEKKKLMEEIPEREKRRIEKLQKDNRREVERHRESRSSRNDHRDRVDDRRRKRSRSPDNDKDYRPTTVDLRTNRERMLAMQEDNDKDDEPVNPKRNKDQERRRKRALEHLQPSLKRSQIYPLINGSVRTTEPGEITMLPRNHNSETDVVLGTVVPKEGCVNMMQGKAIIEKKRKALGCNNDCGLTYSEYKHMMQKPKDPTRKRRYHHERQSVLETAYGLRFPACFFALYEYAVEVDPYDPLNCMTKIGMMLVGPFEEWHKMSSNKSYIPPPQNMIHRHMRYRQYYTPPEFQICLINVKDKSNIGYWRDIPDELPPFIAMNTGDDGRLYAVGPNLMASVKLWLYRRIGSGTLQTRKCFATITDIALKWNIIIERVTYELRERETRCNARTLNTIGICVPVVEDSRGNEIGYRPLEVSDEQLQKDLDAIEEAPNDAIRLKKFKPLSEIFQRIQLANDECDFGMGLEFGISMFAHGSKYFHKMILKVLPLAYELLGRELYAEITKSHLADRRKMICDRDDILPAALTGIGPAIGTFRVMEDDLCKPILPRPVKMEGEPMPKEEPQMDDYIHRIRAKGVYATEDSAGPSSSTGGASDWG